MDKIALLSEIHPKGPEVTLSFYGTSKINMVMLFHPITQAKEWHNIALSRAESDIKLTPPDDEFLAYIEEIYDYVNQNHQFLVIRDWCHLDYTGIPFCQPTYINHLTQILTGRFLLNQVYLIRHPIDQLVSFAKAIPVQFSLEKYLYGYLAYIKSAPPDQLVKYEDFVDSPDGTLRKITQMLEVPYDPEWSVKWSQNRKITGDFRAIGKAQETAEASIERRPRPPVAPNILQSFERSNAYQEILALTGYSYLF